jgi:peptidoglycan/LPS O-acetylase OafA/YrhL
MTIKGALGNIFCVGFFATQEYDFNWYLPLLWICYLLAPLWKKVIDRYPSFRSLVMVLLLIIIMEVPFWGRAMDMMAYTRLPIFYAGMWFGQYADSEKDIKKSHKIAWILAAFPSAAVAYYFVCIRPGIGWNMGLNWYPFLGIVPGICFLLSWICDILAATRMRGLLSFGSFIGKHSLEIYLVHVLFFEIYKDYIRPNNIVVHRTRNWLVLLLLTAIGCVCLHYMEQGVRTAFKKLADRSKTE